MGYSSNEKRDGNGIMQAVSTVKIDGGMRISFHYGEGRVTHFMPSKIIPHLLHDLMSANERGQNVNLAARNN